jgi:hypothetical protein
MASIEVIMSEREPGMVQLFATGCDASVAALAGIVQAAVWLPTESARRLQALLDEKLDEGDE